MSDNKPKIAIIDPNTLAALGLRQMLQDAMPMMSVESFGSISELMANNAEQYLHYFTAMNVVLENMPFFIEHRRRTIVLTLSTADGSQLKEFHCLCINQPERFLVHDLLALQQKGHPHGKNLPPAHPASDSSKILSDREAEVMSLIVRGYINKEIADRLNIALSTVITHRKNIMEKLGMKSVSALTIYAVMNGYVDINSI